MEQPTQKINIVENVIIAGTGEIGLDQRFCAVVGGISSKFKSMPHEKAGVMIAGAFIENVKETYLNNSPYRPGHYGALLAYVSKKDSKYCLCEFHPESFQPEWKTPEKIWFASMGGGQYITDPFLGFLRHLFWQNKQPSLEEGKFITKCVLKHVIDVNPGGIKEPIQMAIIDSTQEAKILNTDELGEVLNLFERYEKHCRSFTIEKEQPVRVPPVPEASDK